MTTRPLPHDLEAETSVLGAILLDQTVIDRVVDLVKAEDFYRENNGQVYRTALKLHERGEPIDIVTMAGELEKAGVLERVGGRAHLALLMEGVPTAANAEHYARMVKDCAVRRNIGKAAAQVAELTYDSSVRTPQVLQSLGKVYEGAVSSARGAEEPRRSSWKPVDIRQALAGGLKPPQPTQLARTDGVCLLYPGKSHSFVGEPETCKSLCAQVAVSEALKRSGTALYIDFETEVNEVIGRLVALGVPENQMDGLIYVRPEEPPEGHDIRSMLMDLEPDIAVIDGVENSMGMFGLNTSDRKDYAVWSQRLVLPVQRATPGPTIQVDHVVKDKEKRGGYASGAGNKKALVDVMYVFEVVKPFGIGLEGLVRVIVEKDRPGSVRQHCNGKKVAELHLSSDVDTRAIAYALRQPMSGDAATTGRRDDWRPTELMERVSRLLEESTSPLSGNAIRGGVQGRNGYVRDAAKFLVRDGFATATSGPRKSTLYASVRPYRQTTDVSSAAVNRAAELLDGTVVAMRPRPAG